MFKKILVPVDLTEEGLTAPAIDVALGFAKASGGDLRFLSVQSHMAAALVDYVTADFDAQVRYAIEQEIANVAASIDYSPERLSISVGCFAVVYEEVVAAEEGGGAELMRVGSGRPRIAI